MRESGASCGVQHAHLGYTAVLFVPAQILQKFTEEGCHRVRCSFRNPAMAAKHLVADNGGHRHAVKHVVHKLVKQATVNGAECQCALVVEAAGAVLIEPPAGA